MIFSENINNKIMETSKMLMLWILVFITVTLS